MSLCVIVGPSGGPELARLPPRGVEVRSTAYLAEIQFATRRDFEFEIRASNETLLWLGRAALVFGSFEAAIDEAPAHLSAFSTPLPHPFILSYTCKSKSISYNSIQTSTNLTSTDTL